MAAAIGKLPEEVIRTLRSSFIIGSLANCVEELVQNAIDAGAESIEVALNTTLWSCRVTDNGHGISRHDLRQIGRRYG